jgi:hypothetical protein
VLGEMMHYATTQAVRGKLKPGSWAEAIVDAVDRGEADQAVRPALMIDYVGPSLETTIFRDRQRRLAVCQKFRGMAAGP